MRCAAASSICSRPAWTSRCGSISSATRWNRSAASIRKPSAPPTSCARSTSCRWRSSSSPATPSADSAPAMSRRSARPTPDDVLYEAVSEGRRYAGMEHWLPLFHKRLDTLFDYLRGTRRSSIEPLAEEAAHERLAQIADYYEARKEALDQIRRRRALQAAAAGPALSRRSRMAGAARRAGAGAADAVRAAGGRAPTSSMIGAPCRTQFRAERSEPSTNVFEAVTQHVQALQAAGKRALIALWSDGSRERMAHVLAEHGLANLAQRRVVAAGAGAAAPASRARRARPRGRFRDRRRRGHQRAGHSRRAAGAAAPRSRSARKISSPR